MWVPLSLVRSGYLFEFERLYLVLFLFSSSYLKSSIIDGILTLPSTLLYCAFAHRTLEAVIRVNSGYTSFLLVYSKLQLQNNKYIGYLDFNMGN